MEFTDRYQALGIPEPCLWTMCKGFCGGTGFVPVYIKDGDKRTNGLFCENNTDPKLINAWEKAQKENPCDDGWHFVKCPDCNGSGKKYSGSFGRFLHVISTIYYPFSYAIFTITNKFEDWSYSRAIKHLPRSFKWMFKKKSYERKWILVFGAKWYRNERTV